MVLTDPPIVGVTGGTYVTVRVMGRGFAGERSGKFCRRPDVAVVGHELDAADRVR
jgi:hypothetical protein